MNNHQARDQQRFQRAMHRDFMKASYPDRRGGVLIIDVIKAWSRRDLNVCPESVQ